MLAADLWRFEEDDQQLIGIIQRNSLRMIRLLDDVLLLGRIDRGELGLDIGPRNVEPIFREEMRLVSNIADSRGVCFDLVSDIEDVRAVVDQNKLARILSALLGNAARFVAENGLVTIRVEIAGGKVLLSLEDDGPGIDESEQTRIFQRFYRGARGSDAHGGAGLGLAIARELALAMGGELTFRPVQPVGSAFILTLPAAEPGT